MLEKSKKHNNDSKKGFISEEDISSLLQRYTVNTVLALLQEIAQFEGVKIDWNALVKKTSTGISNVREYQMLWRHLAYRHSLLDNLGDAARPLDDDSDLEYEVEALPYVSSEASAEAAACVKVLMASGAQGDSAHPNGSTVEAPLTINIPNGLPVRAMPDNPVPTIRGMNITVPVSVQKQPLPAVASVDGLDMNGLGNGNIPPQRKRRRWSDAEDLELIAAVQKYGERDWKNILRSECKWDRTSDQLSKRWRTIQKRNGNMNPVGNTRGVQLTEAQRAARHAMNLALDLPVKNTFTNKCGEGTQVQHQSQQPFAAKSSPLEALGPAPKSQLAVKKPSNPDLTSDSVRATAVAAGARIATQSDAATLLRAAQAKNAVHIMPAAASAKISLVGGASTHPVTSSSAMPPLVPAAAERTPTIPDTAKNTAAKQSDAELPSKKDPETAEGVLSEDGKEQQVKEHEACASASGCDINKQIQVEKVAQLNPKSQPAIAESCNASSKLSTTENGMVDVPGKKVEGRQNSHDDKIMCLSAQKESTVIQVDGDIQSKADKRDQTSLAIDRCHEKLEAASKSEPDNTTREGER